MRPALETGRKRASLFAMRRRALITAFISLLWERAVPVVWPTLGALAVFSLAALLGVWESIGDPWRTIAAFVLLAAAIWQTRRALPGFVWPDHEAVARRIEEDSGITARPHEALEDKPADDDALALQVWEEHQARMKARLNSAFARRPKAAWAEADRFALRGALAVLLVTGWWLAGPSARDRLDEAFALRPMSVDRGDLSLDAWIDPPAYTGRAPVFLRSDDTEAAIPQGSSFIARVAGARRPPRLELRSGDGRQQAEVTEIGAGVYEARIVVANDANMRLIAGGLRRNWQLSVTPDNAPDVRLLDIPEGTANGELDLEFAVTDDYGATAYALEFQPEDNANAPWERIELSPSGVPESDADGALRALPETGRHPMAGQRVTIRISAEDAGGNTGRSATMAVTLPERVFLDALARAVTEQRRVVLSNEVGYAPLPDRPVMYAEDIPPGLPYLAEEPERRIERAPDGLQGVASALDAITDAPRYFFEDPVVYLGLREALHRLRRSRDLEDLDGLEADLWEIALRAELGSLADAERALRAAERALAEALARGADETELAALFDAYEQAMENYMAALAREAAEEGRFAEGGGEGGMSTEGLQQLLEALREAAELGDTADARQALAALSELLRNMQMQLSRGGGGEGEQDDPVAEAIQRALEELGDVIGEQRDLQDQTFNLDENQGAGQPGQPQQGGQPSNQSGDMPQGLAENQNGGTSRSQQLADMQAELADALRRSLEAVPEGGDPGLGDAAGAMEEAENALRQGDTGAALDAQEEALAELREGAEELARTLLERMQAQQGQDGQGEEAGERDPLGRPTDGSFADGSGVEVPDELSRARAREILEELRRRAAEAGRPAEELEYIERLLDRF